MSVFKKIAMINRCVANRRLALIVLLGSIFILLGFWCFDFRSSAYSTDNVKIVLKVGYEKGCPPFQWTKNENLQGLHVDLLRCVADIQNYQLEFISVKGIDDGAKKLENNEIDILLGVTQNEGLRGDLVYSDPISESNISILMTDMKAEEFMRNDSSLELVSIEENSVHHSVISAISSIGGASFFVCANQEDAIDSFLNGETDAVIGVKDSILYQLSENREENQYTIVNNNVASIRYYICSSADNYNIVKDINSALRQMRASGEYDNIANRWIKSSELRAQVLVRNVKIIAAVCIVIACIFVIFEYRLNRLLKEKVNEKTEELQSVNDALREKITEIRENNEIRNKVVDQSPSGIIVMDCQMNITMINEKAKDMIDNENVKLGQPVLISPLIRCIWNDKCKRVGKSGECSGYEVKVMKDSYTERSYRYDVYNLYTENREKRGEIMVLEDVTDEIRIKNEIFEKEKNSVLNQMIAEISHDILNPLTAIRTLAELAPQKKQNESFYLHFSEIVPKEVDRVTVLIKRLLNYAKPSGSKREITDVSAVINSCAQLMEPVMKKDGIILELRTEKNSFLYVDEGQFKQSMLNLITNSMDAILEKKKISSFEEELRIKISEWRENNMVYIQVKDNGIGMTEGQKEMATTPFFTTKSNGSGLGLSMAKRFASENGGKLIVESVYRKGATVTFCFQCTLDSDRKGECK